MEEKESKSTVKRAIEKLIVRNDKWIEHIIQEDVPASHRMFAAESYYRSFWESAEHSIILIDEDYSIIDVNPAFCDLVEMTAAEICTKNLKDFIPCYNLHTDMVNIDAMVRGDQYSFSDDHCVQSKPTKKPVPVRIVATRVPASLQHPFRHIVMHIYEKGDDGYPLQIPSPVYQGSWGDVLKKAVKEHFTGVLITLVVLFVLCATSGGLAPIIQKLFEWLM